MSNEQLRELQKKELRLLLDVIAIADQMHVNLCRILYAPIGIGGVQHE